MKIDDVIAAVQANMLPDRGESLGAVARDRMAEFFEALKKRSVTTADGVDQAWVDAIHNRNLPTDVINSLSPIRHAITVALQQKEPTAMPTAIKPGKEEPK